MKLKKPFKAAIVIEADDNNIYQVALSPEVLEYYITQIVSDMGGILKVVPHPIQNISLHYPDEEE